MPQRRRKTDAKPAQSTQKDSIIINQLEVRQVDRNRKDIQDFKMSIMGAESIVMPNRTRLYDLYSDMLVDGHLSGIIDKRIKAVTNKKMYFESRDKTRDESFDELLRSLTFRDLRKKRAEWKFWGLGGIEFIPGQKIHFKEIPRKHIKPHKKVISIMQNGNEGIDYDGVTNLWISEEEDNLGLLLKCAPYAIWKRGSIADWSQFIELFGQPVRIVKYDAYDNKTQSEVKRVLDESGSSLALMIPKQADFEMVDGKTQNATGELQDRMRRACNEEMSVVILGNTETTTSSSSSGYAQSKEHGDQQEELFEDDYDEELAAFNSEQFFAILKSYGYNVDGGQFKYEEEADLDKLLKRKEIDEFVSLKVPISDDHYYETYGVSKPDNYNELRAKMDAEKVQGTAHEEVEEEEEDTPDSGLKTQDSKKKKKPNPKLSPKQVQLNAIQKLQKALADFFDHAR